MSHKITQYFSLFILLIILLSTLNLSCGLQKTNSAEKPHIVFIIGDEEYRSEESMPMLASLTEKTLNAKVTLCFSLDSAGYIDPNRQDHIDNLRALEEADLMVMFTRFRALPDNEVAFILDYVESGKPIVGFRTSTHAFSYKKDSTKFNLNNEWPTRVFGQQWITHHGHFSDGNKPLTEISVISTKNDHPILKGIDPFQAYSWLYHVDGGKWSLYGDSSPLLQGRSLRSNHQNNNRLEEFPMTNPVAWTKTYSGANSQEPARVFFTTLGHPYDFKNENMRRLSLQGIMWALGQEAAIPKNGVDVSLSLPYEPNNSGFGKKY
jgi:type 1 glutamine amidotransferase